LFLLGWKLYKSILEKEYKYPVGNVTHNAISIWSGLASKFGKDAKENSRRADTTNQEKRKKVVKRWKKYLVRMNMRLVTQKYSAVIIFIICCYLFCYTLS